MRLLAPLVLILGFEGSLAAQSADSASAFRAARDAEADYEYAARRLAPLGGSPRAGTCDEYVGRFCLYYDSSREPLPAEPAEIGRIRRQAITLLHKAFDLNPARTATVFPLIRLLLEDKQPVEAGIVADRFGRETDGVATHEMLVALTRHASADIPAAEAAIGRWLAAVDSADRQRLADPYHLLDASERRHYRRLSPPERERYDTLLWRYADALYMTPGNETRTEHFARQAEAMLVRAAPVVRGSTSWGNDVAELTTRFGTVKARTRMWPGRATSTEPDILEYWDPEQLIYVPPALDSVLMLRARPALGWPLDTVRSYSGHAPPTFRRMLPLEHQATLFFTDSGQRRMRVDGYVVADSAARVTGAGPAQGRLFILDDSLRILGSAPATTARRGDTIFFAAETHIPSAAVFYSAELLEDGSRLAARARFRLDPPSSGLAVALSDVMITDAFAPGGLPSSRSASGMRPRPSLIVRLDEPFGVFAEVSLPSAPDSITVQLEFLKFDGSPTVLRAARWIGERLGLRGRTPPNRLGWKTEITTQAHAPLAVTLDPRDLRPGRYFIDLMVMTRAGQRSSARREILIVGRD